MQLGRVRAAGMRRRARHCERSEAIQSYPGAMDCFASLAMTVSKAPCVLAV
jgi:hypothetical protein